LFTPTSNTDATTASVSVVAGSYADLAGNSGTAGSTSFSEDTTTPTGTTGTYGPRDGALAAGRAVTLTVQFNETVNVSGKPTLSLNDGGTATYTGGYSTALIFTYTAAAPQTTSDLTLALTNAFNLPGGATVKDVAGNNGDLSGANNINPAGILAVDT